MNASRPQLPWNPGALPARVRAALARGVQRGEGMPLAQAPRLLEPGEQALEDGVLRNPDGTLVIAVRTGMPGVTGGMIDWWFGWHLASSERYRLWHPGDHVRATAREDRSHLPDDRARYVGNVSYVDESIGGRLMRLAIEFVPPDTYGLEPRRFAEAGVDTAVCARTAFQGGHLAVGHLIHLVRRVPGGCELRSRFWLGDIEVRLPGPGRPLSRLFNLAWPRRCFCRPAAAQRV